MPAKTKTPRTPKTATPPPIPLAEVRAAIESLTARRDDFLASIKHSCHPPQVTQEVLLAYQALQAAKESLEKIIEAARQSIIEAKERGATVEPGALVAILKVFDRTTVQWKDVALETARKLAEERGEDFHPEVFEAQTKAQFGTTTTVKSLSVQPA